MLKILLVCLFLVLPLNKIVGTPIRKLAMVTRSKNMYLLTKVTQFDYKENDSIQSGLKRLKSLCAEESKWEVFSKVPRRIQTCFRPYRLSKWFLGVWFFFADSSKCLVFLRYFGDSVFSTHSRIFSDTS